MGLLLFFSLLFIYGFSVFHCFDSHCVLLQDIWSLLCVSPSTLISTSFPISPQRIFSNYTDVMYHFFYQALHVGTDIGSGFISNGLLFCFCAFAVIFWITIFWVGKQAVGESYGNVKMPGNGF